MITFRGVSHVAFTVTDLAVSERFYTELLGFVTVLDVGHGRVCMHPQSGFTISLFRPEAAQGGEFTELATGLDHLGLGADSRDELEEWQRRFEQQGVPHSPIQDSLMGSSLNFRDPDGIALEFDAPTAMADEARRALAAGPSADEIAAFVTEHFGPEFVPKPL